MILRYCHIELLTPVFGGYMVVIVLSLSRLATFLILVAGLSFCLQVGHIARAWPY